MLAAVQTLDGYLGRRENFAYEERCGYSCADVESRMNNFEEVDRFSYMNIDRNETLDVSTIPSGLKK